MIKAKYFLLLSFSLLSIISIESTVIHIFGDSHAHHCFGSNDTPRYFDAKDHINYVYTYKNNTFAIHWVGAKTLYRIGKDGLNILNIREYGVNDNDVVVFTFGEIDTRCHIGKQRDQYKRSLDEVIHSLVTNYIHSINQNRKLFNNLIFAIMEVIPPTNQSYNHKLPFHGSLEDRVVITNKLNTALHDACKQHNILFLPTHNIYADENGSLNASLSDTLVHISFSYNYLLKEQLLILLDMNK